jgi:FkbM family methyltransferase
MNILAHTCIIGTTGYANHARSFFTHLNKYQNVKVRNFTIGANWGGINGSVHDNEPYMTDELKGMLYQQTLFNSDGSRSDFKLSGYDENFKADVHIVLNDMNHYYFYDNYEGYKIAYNVWETTLYPDDYFNQLLKFDEVWVPTQWQFDALVNQGYPSNKISIITEGVDIETFTPIKKIPNRKKFKFLLFGRWEYRKGTAEIIKAFGEEFKGIDDVELIASVENPYPYDGLKTTQERIDKFGLDYPNVRYINFPSRNEYVKYLQEGNVFVSCARSEGWNLPLIEAMSCGTPSIYSDWGGQLEFAQGKGIPVKIEGLIPANFEHKDFLGEYCEPDWEDLRHQLRNSYENYKQLRVFALAEAKDIHENFNWDKVAKDASDMLEKKLNKDFVFVTTGNIGYMSVIEKLVQSLLAFSSAKILVYGIDCDVPFDYPNVIKRRIDPPKYSEHDKWYWKQYACIESFNETDYDNFVWIDGDVVVNYNIDTIDRFFKDIDNYPLSDIHRQEEFYGYYSYNGETKNQSFNEELAREWGVQKRLPYLHVCMFVYNRNCDGWFEQVIDAYKAIDLKDYSRLFLWNDEGIENALRWKYGYTKHLPLSNFDTSSYDGDAGQTQKQLDDFYTFWNKKGPYNFDRVYGYQYIPRNKEDVLYFHGNKNADFSDKMVEFIKLKVGNNFYKSEHFYTDIYKVEHLGDIKGYEGGTIEVAEKFGWFRAIYHEIFNLLDYEKNRERAIFDGDVVVDLGGNIGIFNRWAYSKGASKVISFEPDTRYFKLLSLNADPRSIIFNAAAAHEIGEINLHQTDHIGGSNIFGSATSKGYPVRTYTLNYLFETGLVDKIDFLKVDIEGAEHAAFAGISDENLLKVRNIAMEYHHSFFNFDDDIRTQFMQRFHNLGFTSYLLFMGTNNALQMLYFKR